jgi:hypothetical protein
MSVDLFSTPSFVTPEGTKTVVAASPTGGLAISSRSANGSDMNARIPTDVALALLDNADQLRAALKGE